MKEKLSLPVSDAPVFFEAPVFVAQGALVSHGFFTRMGGVSTGVYAALNCGPGSGDEPESVQRNREIVAGVLGCDGDRLLSLYQVHGAECVYVRQPWSMAERPQADAMVTDVPGLALGILTADCAPVLLCGHKVDGAPVIGAAHAGWGGALKGALERTVERMAEAGAVRASICAAIGPCIGKASYEVTEDFSVPFLSEDEHNDMFFMAGARPGHLMFDLPGYCAYKLAKAGVGNVYIKDLDTYFNEEEFFSYRRATHRQEKDYGRQISAIMIRAE